MGGSTKNGVAPSSNTSPDATPENEAGSRGNWGNQVEFFLSCLGYAVGFGNVWRFPYLCYKNGGAAFLIPYAVMLLVAGLPLFFLELALGQYASLGPNILFPKLSPIMGGIGWGMIITTGLVTIFYNMVFAWSLFYTFGSFTSELAWGSCDNYFNNVNCYTFEENANCRNQSMYYFNKTCLAIKEFCDIDSLENFNETHCITASGDYVKAEIAVKRVSASEDYFRSRMLGINGKDWSNMGGIRWELLGCLALAWLVVGASLIRGVRSSGKVVYFTAIFPYVVLVILFFRGITLEGAYKGIEFYILKPNMTRLSEPEVWNDAAAQIFFSLSTAFGGLITLASYNGFTVNCMRDAIVISFCNCLTSVFAGFVIFSILGFMASSAGVEVTEVVSSGSGLAFIAYPAAVTMMPVPPLWSCLFFFMFITLGLDSQFAFVETLTTGIFDSFPVLRKRQELVVSLFCFGMFLFGIPFCLEGGAYLFELFNWFSGWLSVIVFAILEVITISYLYGFKKFMRNIKEEMGVPVPSVFYYYFGATWMFITPVVLSAVFFFSIYYYTPAYYGDYVYPPAVQGLGWCLVLVSIFCLPIAAIYQYTFNGKKTWKELRGPTDDFVPAHVLKLMEAEGRQKGVRNEPPVHFNAYDNEAFSDGQVTMRVNNSEFQGYGASSKY